MLTTKTQPKPTTNRDAPLKRNGTPQTRLATVAPMPTPAPKPKTKKA